MFQLTINFLTYLVLQDTDKIINKYVNLYHHDYYYDDDDDDDYYYYYYYYYNIMITYNYYNFCCFIQRFLNLCILQIKFV